MRTSRIPVPVSMAGGPRALGALAGAVRESDDCWAPDPELEALFYGSQADATDLPRVAERSPEE
ncbi:MAG TPA: hypothetical protein VGA37_05465 [Gemmatimonadales bacterium]